MYILLQSAQVYWQLPEYICLIYPAGSYFHFGCLLENVCMLSCSNTFFFSYSPLLQNLYSFSVWKVSLSSDWWQLSQAWASTCPPCVHTINCAGGVAEFGDYSYDITTWSFKRHTLGILALYIQCFPQNSFWGWWVTSWLTLNRRGCFTISSFTGGM